MSHYKSSRLCLSATSTSTPSRITFWNSIFHYEAVRHGLFSPSTVIPPGTLYDVSCLGIHHLSSSWFPSSPEGVKLTPALILLCPFSSLRKTHGASPGKPSWNTLSLSKASLHYNEALASNPHPYQDLADFHFQGLVLKLWPHWDVHRIMAWYTRSTCYIYELNSK